MRYKLTYHPNPDCLTIHVDKVLTNKMIESFDGPDDNVMDTPRPFVNEIFEIDGVEKVTLQRYELGLTKGTVFGWDEILSKAIMILLLHLCPNEKAGEIGAPKRYHIDENGFSKDETPEEKEELHVFELSNVLTNMNPGSKDT